jgi:hypothetical protein
MTPFSGQISKIPPADIPFSVGFAEVGLAKGIMQASDLPGAGN